MKILADSHLMGRATGRILYDARGPESAGLLVMEGGDDRYSFVVERKQNDARRQSAVLHSRQSQHAVEHAGPFC
jgi:hypothetical protein